MQEKRHIFLLPLLALVVFIGQGCPFTNTTTEPTPEEVVADVQPKVVSVKTTPEKIEGDNFIIEQSEITIAPIEEVQPEPIPEPPQENKYIDYSESAVKSAIAAGKRPVIFFHAAWCPTCKSAEREFTTHQDEIPSDIVILKADYDSSKDLKKRYGVTYQHTFVQVDGNGDMITKWIGGDISELRKRAQ